ncbi:MAG: discoidin domain-containing protein [Nostocaceae cyanobacterium]|nr:discoidin domain-containing protein [Nostocaceae cyanobacterium]
MFISVQRWLRPKTSIGLILGVSLLLPNTAIGKQVENTGTVTIDFTPGHAVNTFIPNEALGAGLDGLEKGDIARLYTPDNIRQMKSAGFGPISYRLRTELGIEAWHWNEKGTWSDSEHLQGYWTSSDRATQPILISHGYRLPRRGNTLDQAAKDSYSRLDDGDTTSFWKSNPYLDKYYTKEDNALHPQWVLVDLLQRRKINAAKIFWGNPYATRYQVEYWDGVDFTYLNDTVPGQWRVFPQGQISGAKGGEVLHSLSQKLISARYLRIVATEASGTAPIDSQDIRDRLGYAIREIYFGTLDKERQFHDVMRHGKTKDIQTLIYTSSTDPWHRASDLDPNLEQPGFDQLFRNGLTNGLPMLTPVGVFYDTPENAAAEIRFFKARGYPIRQIEMGEEPDGQNITPEHYGALYIQFAKAIHAVDPTLQLGGPGFQSEVEGWSTFPNAQGNRSWMNRFLNYLRDRHHFDDFNFFSFEWYPFDNLCQPPASQLAQAPSLMSNVFQRLRQDGVPTTIPWIITEYGYSSFAGQAEVEIPSALLNADIVGQFLTLGGKSAYLYGYEPNVPIREMEECDTWGNMMLFLADDEGRIRAPMPTYYGAQLLTQEWTQSGNQPHQLYRASSDIRNRQGQPLVNAYAVYRPDHQWAILLINKDPQRSWSVKIRFHSSPDNQQSFFQDNLDIFQYSSQQYAWHPQGKDGYPIRSQPPQHSRLQGKATTQITLPAYSLTVVRGNMKERSMP